MRRFLTSIGLTVVAVSSAVVAVGPSGSPRLRQAPPATELRPTVHRSVPADLQRYWLVPPAGWHPLRADEWNAARDLARAATLLAAGKPAQALPLIRVTALETTPLGGYAAYFKGLAQSGLDRDEAARATLGGLRASHPQGFLVEAVSLRLADDAESRHDFGAAVAIYEELLTQKPSAPDQLLLRLARAADQAGNKARALTAYQALYYDWPASDAASTAEKAISASDVKQIASDDAWFTRELGRAEHLFAARQFTLAREAFAHLRPHATGDGSELVPLRLAECDYFLRHLRGARDDLRPFLDRGARRAEARYFDLLVARELGDRDEYVGRTRALVDQFPDSSWAEDALNSLATFFIVDDQDEQADQVLREMLTKFPTGRYTARAAWRVGWWAYRHGRFADAAEVFERAAVTFPRSDYRPSYVYWAGRSRDRMGDGTEADARFQLAVTDYANSYYGRLASTRLAARGTTAAGGGDGAQDWTEPAAAQEPLPATADLVRWLISVELYDAALDEVQYAERTWGSSTVLQATRAWLLNRRGDLRPAITLMRQAYPQFLAAGGEALPKEILRIIFPLDYWPLIRQHAAAAKLDPYLVAALIAQESTFDKDVKSAANAYGLMQIVPATGRRWARRLGIRGYSTRKLTVAEVNIRIGTSYFADLLQQFGSVHVALAGYNAGDSRAAQWSAERPGLPPDEFVDDIPFAETQNYIRRILGTAEDYRRLYGAGTPEATGSGTQPRPVIIRPPHPGRRDR